ncbi:YebY family protein [Hymenobacter sp. HSC-4F20]|uniref:DUF2511 domain-containing protein n=1 Tax=Hymenobacter sp. HSC-4F20 TaxID=2864135 RepID=UPI001C72B549|nr:DUF2511 domain-containing protein [Hymenobacter sp. HSC-4F20]MBX0289179.1 YebY family protein [Hymenobacter sp. HSC-4F20]
MKEIDTHKVLAILEELETSNKLIRLGFGELQNIGQGNDFYFLPFQLLSQGIERFMKSYICLAYSNKNKKLPDARYLKKFGHDLELLLNEINQFYYLDYNRPQFNIDRTFILSNEDLKELLHIISEFGKFARYYNFDVITDSDKKSIDAISSWQEFENKILSTNKANYAKLIDYDSSYEVGQSITNYIIVVFEKFISSLSRQFIFDQVGELGKQLTVNSYLDFGMLYGNDYGKTDYRKSTTKYIETPKRVHKRNFIDEVERKCNPNYKHLKISKSEYNKEWPFYSDNVIVECRYNHWCIVTIDGHDYSLNGAAKGKYKLENPHDAGMAILGKSLNDFINIARNL